MPRRSRVAPVANLNARPPERAIIQDVPVEVRRSKRRRTRLGLAFDPGGYVIVEAPMDASTGEIRAVIHEHRRWLLNRLEKVTDRTGLTSCLTYESGELLHYLGRPYVLVVLSGSVNTVELLERRRIDGGQLRLFDDCAVQGQIFVSLTHSPGLPALGGHDRQARVREAVHGWYQRRADGQLHRQMERWRYELPWLRGRLPEWRHRFMRSQWGSCSRHGRINLNTHLVKTPRRLMEYVVLHELCHLRHYDHSPRFYGLMSRHMPDWEKRRCELDHYLPVLLQD